MMIDVKKAINTIKMLNTDVVDYLNIALIMDPFYADFQYTFCWSSNAIEGNTLSLEETISFLQFDEVRSGHTFSEYEEVKRLDKAIKTYLSFAPKEISEEWIKKVNAEIIGNTDEYREEDVYVGSQIEAVYYPPTYEKVPDLMKDFIVNINDGACDLDEIIELVARKHIEFERIHPFVDGNGRTGRIILNQQLINNGLLPITIEPKSKYRQAFKIYNKSKDISLMKYIICKGQEKTLNKILQLGEKYDKVFAEKQPEFKPEKVQKFSEEVSTIDKSNIEL